MVLQFHLTFKPFLSHVQKRERARERKSSAMKIERSSKASIAPQGKPISPRSSKASIAEIVHRDRWDRLPRSRKAPRRSQSHEASITISRSTMPVAIAGSVDRDLVKHRADRSPSLNPIASLSSFFSQFDRIWWFFFSGFCLCFCIEEWMIFYIRLAIEKMWATSRKCVFYGIFKNTTKHQKIFFETFFEMQPNTWKHFPFRKIAFLENGIFSGNAFIQTKRSLNYKFL